MLTAPFKTVRKAIASVANFIVAMQMCSKTVVYGCCRCSLCTMERRERKCGEMVMLFAVAVDFGEDSALT